MRVNLIRKGDVSSARFPPEDEVVLFNANAGEVLLCSAHAWEGLIDPDFRDGSEQAAALRDYLDRLEASVA